MRHRDLTEIIGKRSSKSYLSRALAAGWNEWGRYEREEADALHPRLRRLARVEHQRLLGLQAPC
jgi:hypothetical protein